MERKQYDLVVHCAAIVGGRALIDGDPLTVAADLSIDAQLFNWVVNTQQPRLVYYSSSAAYPVSLQHSDPNYSLHEDDITVDRTFDTISKPDMTYGWTKLTGEYLAQFARERDIEVFILRPFSGYGPGQSLAYPMSALCARALREEDPFDVWCAPNQTRDWVHISDVIEATLAVVKAGDQRPVNVCTGVPTSFEELIQSIFALTGFTPNQVRYRNDMPNGVSYRVGNPERMREHYMPSVTLGMGIADVLDDLTMTGEYKSGHVD
jgi:nucleoside-diphosphate-sugar epimerase